MPIEDGLETRYLGPFVKATTETFLLMVKTSIHPLAQPSPLDLGNPCCLWGTIHFFGGPVQSMSLGFPKDTAQAIVNVFLGGEAVSEANLADAVQEIANVVAGAAKKRLGRNDVRMSLPILMEGNDRDTSEEGGEVRRAGFACRYGFFELRIRLKPKG